MSQEYELTLGLREITNAIWMDGHGDSRFPGYDFVIRLSGELIEKFPKVGELYAHRGYAIYQNSFNHYPELSEHYFKSNLEEAMSDINEAIRLSPRKKSSDLYYKKALIYKSQKKFVDALSSISIAISTNEYLNNYYSDISGEINEALEKYDEAIIDFKKSLKALKGQPGERFWVNISIGRVNYKLGNYERALKYLNKFISLDSSKQLKRQLEEAYLLRGLSLLKLSKNKEAITDLDLYSSMIDDRKSSK